MLTFCTQTVKASVEAKRPHGMTVSDERLAGTPPETLGLGRQGRGWKEDEVLVCHQSPLLTCTTCSEVVGFGD